ncbi:lamin tail domain-containing protein [Candidatus Woesearchaeota archaeon]|nr:lamin tail domain-containing protein [Candidatus Woesearchaeota archaeon]
MKNLSLNILVLLFLLSANLALGDVVINEVMYNPSGSDSYDEFIEIYNNGDYSENLDTYNLCSQDILEGYINNADGTTYLETGLTLAPGEYALITDGGTGTKVYTNFDVDDNAIAFHVNGNTLCGGLDHGDTISITNVINSDILVIDSNWGGNGDGKTLEKINGFINDNTQSNWQESRIGGTPGSNNNDVPTAVNSAVTTEEDTAYIFTISDFKFADEDADDNLNSIKITGLETAGDLELAGVDITINQVIPAASIASLTFKPVDNAYGAPYATFNFKVNDGTEDSVSSYTMTINVNSRNDPPTSSSPTAITINEDATYTFSSSNFPFSDIDGNTLNSIKIASLETAGDLKLAGVDVTLNQVIPVASITSLTFKPVDHAFGTPYATFNFKVNDGTDDSVSSYTMTINVNLVNDLPVITAIPNGIATEGVEFTYIIQATDVETASEDLEISSVMVDSVPGWLEIDSASDPIRIKGAPGINDKNKNEKISITVIDSDGGSGTKDFYLDIIPALQIDPATIEIEIDERVYHTTDNLIVAPGSDVILRYQFTNNYDKTLGHVEASAWIDVNRNGEFDDNLDLDGDGVPEREPEFVSVCQGASCDEGDWALTPGAAGSSELVFALPYNIGPIAAFDLHLEIIYDDFWSLLGITNPFTDESILPFTINREEASVIFNDDEELGIVGVEVTDDKLSCTRTAQFELNLVNIGQEQITPEILLFDKQPVESSFNGLTGKFADFTGGTPTIRFEETLSPILSAGTLPTAFWVDLSSLSPGTYTLYLYIVNPYFSSAEHYIGDYAEVQVTIGNCLNVSALEEDLTIVKGSNTPLSVNLGNYLLDEDINTLGYTFTFAVEDQSNEEIVNCEIASSTLIQCTPNSATQGSSEVIISIDENDGITNPINETFTVSITPSLEVSSVKVNTITVNENGLSTALKPQQEVSVQFTVTNRLSHPVTGVVGELSFDSASPVESSKVNLNAGEAKQITITTLLPLSLVEGEYPATISVSGRDYEDVSIPQADLFSFKLNVQQDAADLVISSLSLQDNTLTCASSTTLSVNYINRGSQTENDAVFILSKGSLELERRNIGVISGNSQGTEPFVVLAKDLTSGANTLTVTLKYRDDFKTDTKTIVVTKNNCLAISEPVSGSLVIADNTDQPFSVLLTQMGADSQIKWFVDNVERTTSNGVNPTDPSKFTFNEATAGTYQIKVEINGKETRTWTVTVTDVPISTNLIVSPDKKTIENSKGKITYQNSIDDFGNLVSLDSYVTISDDLVSVNTASDGSVLQGGATITLNKAFSTTPKILYSSTFNAQSGFVTCDTTTTPKCTPAATQTPGKYTFTVDGFSTYKVVENIPAGLEVLPTEVFFNDVARGQEATVVVTVKNKGTLDSLTGVTAALYDINGINPINIKYNVASPATPLSTLDSVFDAGKQNTLTVKVKVPSDESAGKHKIGTLRITSTNPAEIKNIDIYLQPKSLLSITKIEINGKESGKLSLEEVNKIEVNVENLYTDDMNNILVTAKLLDVDGDDIEVESDSFDLSSDRDKTVSLDLDLTSETIDQEKYTLEVTVEGTADDDSEHSAVETKELTLDLATHKVIISKLTASNTNLKCERQVSLQATIDNKGKSQEDDIELTLTNTALGINSKKTGIELDELFGTDNSYRASFSLNLDDKAAGTYTLSAEVFRDGNSEDTEELTLTIEDCPTTTTSTSTTTSTGSQTLSLASQQLAQELQNALAVPIEQKQPVTSSFRDTTTYTTLLALLTVLVAIAGVLGMFILLKKRY